MSRSSPRRHLSACWLPPPRQTDARDATAATRRRPARPRPARGRRQTVSGRLGALRARARGGARGRRRQSRGCPRRDARHRRRDRLRQVHARALHQPAPRPHLRPRRLRRPGHLDALAPRVAAVPLRDADDLPGPVQLAEPAPPGRLDHRRPVRDSGNGRRRRAQATRPGADGARRPQPGALQPFPGRVLRRSATEDRRCARSRAAPEARHLRRAGLRARRLDPGADHQSARRPSGGVRADVRLHRARPLGRSARQRPHRGHVPGQVRRGRGQGRAVRRPRHPYTNALPSAIPESRSAGGSQRILLRGDVPSPDPAAVRMPLSSALSEGSRALCERRAAPRERRRGHGRVPLPGRARRAPRPAETGAR